MAKKVFFPPKTFDDDLTAFVDLYEAKKWTFSGIDKDVLLADAPEQRKQRKEHDELEIKYTNVRETFIREQEARYTRFAAALNAARGAFRGDPITLKELARFKRSIRKTRSTEGKQS
ncbi:MAG: hypothetical protein AMXMBFR64_27100 [Myxococcales bacterium]